MCKPVNKPGSQMAIIVPPWLLTFLNYRPWPGSENREKPFPLRAAFSVNASSSKQRKENQSGHCYNLHFHTWWQLLSLKPRTNCWGVSWTYQSGPDHQGLPAYPRIPQPLLPTGYGWHTVHCTLCSNSPIPELDCSSLSPRGSSLYNGAIWSLPPLFWYLCPLGCCTWLPSRFLSTFLSPSHMAQGLSTLNSHRCLGCGLCPPFYRQ